LKTEEHNYNEPLATEEYYDCTLPNDDRIIQKIENIETLDEYEEENAPDDAIAVQIICEQVKVAQKTYLRMIKIYHDEKGPTESHTRVCEN